MNLFFAWLRSWLIQNFLQGNEAGYGKSPEWVEVNGLIVSRGAHLTSTMNSLNNSSAGSALGLPGPAKANTATMASTSHGSVLSLRTQLTYNSASSTQRSSGRSRSTADLETLERLKFALGGHHHDLEIDEEPPYETIPSIVNITDNLASMVSSMVRTEAMLASEAKMAKAASMEAAAAEEMHQDESVISAHDLHLGIYDVIKRPTELCYTNRKLNSATHSTFPFKTDSELFRKKLLMQDANETRL